MRSFVISLILVLFSLTTVFSQEDQTENPSIISVELPSIIIRNIEQEIIINLSTPSSSITNTEVYINDIAYSSEIIDDKIVVIYDFPNKETIVIEAFNESTSIPVNPIPAWFSILPPLLAILIALIIKEVYSALFTGIWLGAGIIYFYQGNSFFIAVFKGFLAIIDTYIIQSLNDGGHLSIILFSMLIAATVSLISKNGGMKGVVNRISRFATNARSGSLVAWALGIAIFFDDYANTLVVGNTMRPLADKLRISREKLSYIIDSTAAPVASIAFVTTWIGAELSYIQDGIEKLQIDESAYGVFFNSLAFSYYPFFTLAFVFLLIWNRVDFGPMYKAEIKARTLNLVGDNPDETIAKDLMEEVTAKVGVRARSFNAIIPVAVIILGTLTGLLYTGWNSETWLNSNLGFFDKLSETIGNSDSYIALLWASMGSLMVAVLLTVSQRLLSLTETVESIIAGFKTMLPAIMILTLAWSVALITEHLKTADFISQLLLDASVSPYLLPTITFIISALVSFSTGSSWGTMAILYPLILPSGWLVAENSGLDYESTLSIFHNLAAAVLTGSVLGDHCSPISDTTILSSLASSCPHIEHVRTQLPYALTTGAIAIIIGILPASFGVSPWILFPLGIVAIMIVLKVFGKKTTLSTG